MPLYISLYDLISYLRVNLFILDPRIFLRNFLSTIADLLSPFNIVGHVLQAYIMISFAFALYSLIFDFFDSRFKRSHLDSACKLLLPAITRFLYSPICILHIRCICGCICGCFLVIHIYLVLFSFVLNPIVLALCINSSFASAMSFSVSPSITISSA